MNQLRVTLQRHPLTAWPIAIRIAVVFVVTALNQILDFLARIGLTK